MLENRPIAQRALVAAGAFAFVFTAAMAGTAFMLTGGFGYADENNPSVRSPDYGYEFAFASVPEERAAYTESAYAHPSSFDNGAPLEAWSDTWAAREELEGEDDLRMVSLRREDAEAASIGEIGQESASEGLDIIYADDADESAAYDALAEAAAEPEEGVH